MVETRMRVEITSKFYGNPFFGDSTEKDIIEKVITSEKDEGRVLPPCGVCGKLNFNVQNDDAEMCLEFKIERGFFDLNDGWCYCHFTNDDKIYEICVYFENDKPSLLEINRWGDFHEFIDGNEADDTFTPVNSDLTFEPYI